MNHNIEMASNVTELPPHREMGLSDLEYESIKANLGREPNRTELGMFAVLWSEHCSYKSSKPVLKYFSNYRKAIEGDGLENAGIVDIGDGLGITFKVESHNHPSAVEPYEGAATGVGGIIRDILTMGARPIASLNSLRFGDITSDAASEDRRLFSRVVQGIGGYGNCIGVPTVGGEVRFHPRYAMSPLVNAMCVGVLPIKKIASAAAKGVGNAVLYLGSATGRDGIHGATFASEVLDDDNEAKRPNVQIGDPFAGKLLIEATLEALDTGAIVAIQDMGAAGLTCSTCEMSEKGGVGMEINLDSVPVRESDMSSYEIMLSESQERMLAVVTIDREQEVIDIFEKWGLPVAKIGFVTQEKSVNIRHKGEIVATVPTEFICNGCPTLELAAEEPDYLKERAAFKVSEIIDNKRYGESLLKLLATPNITSKNWVYTQYDQTVQTQTALKPGKGDAAVLALRGTKKGISVSIDCNDRHVYAEPYDGGVSTVCEAAINVACTGASPKAVTDCLNYGDPNDPHVYYQFRESVRGLADATEALEIPVLSGNVSFYNQTELGEVHPTPTVGIVGVLEDVEKRIGMGFPKGMGYVYLVHSEFEQAKQDGLGCSEYALSIHGIDDGVPEKPNLETAKSLIELLVSAANEGQLTCAHDCSEGGVAVALAEMCLTGESGCYALVDAAEHFQRHILNPALDRMVDSPSGPGEAIWQAIVEAETTADPWTFSNRNDARLFGEMPGRVLFGVSNETHKSGRMEELFRIAHENRLSLHCLGTYDNANRRMTIVTPSNPLIDLPLDEMRKSYFDSLSNIMDKK